MSPAYLIGPNFISLTFEGKPYTIFDNDDRFVAVKDVIKTKQWDTLDNILNKAKVIAKYSFGKVHVYDGEIHYNGKPVHNSICDKIFSFMREDFPFEPLVAFLDRLMLNPNPHSVEQLYSYIERYKFPITDDGCFHAMKAVTPDFYDKHTRKIRNDVGDEPFLPRELCDSNPNNACAPSLHAGNIDYIQSFGSNNDQVVLVEIDPADVVSCPNDSSYQKLRTCKYKVIKRLGTVAELCGFDKEYAPLNNHGEDLYSEIEFDMDEEDIDEDENDDYDDDSDIETESPTNTVYIAKTKEVKKPTDNGIKWNILSPSGKICRKNMKTRELAIASMTKAMKNKTWKQLYRKGYRAVNS